MRILSTCKNCGNAKDNFEKCQYCTSGSIDAAGNTALGSGLPNKPKSLINKIAWVMVATPAIASIIGFSLEFLIPGCKCNDFGSSCSSCGALGGLIYILKIGGMAYTGFAIVLGLPVLYFIGFIATIFSIFKDNVKP